MKKFEYRVMYHLDVRDLDRVGNDGWELVQVLLYKLVDGKDGRQFFFKKEILSQDAKSQQV